MASADFASRLYFDLSQRVKLRVTGSDRIRFLNGQITNDIGKASETNAVEACVLTAKGKIDAHIFVHRDGESFLVDADPTVQSALQPRLERYVIADDVVIEDVTLQFRILHIIGADPPPVDGSAKIISVDRFGIYGSDIWCTSEQHDQLTLSLSAQFKFCDAGCAEQLRIERGLPRWGMELTPDIIPVEANLEQRCIDYEKGCYIGQETISRMKMSGQRNKQLCGLIPLTQAPLAVGARLFGAAETKDVGWITSTAEREGHKMALGYVKRGSNAPGTKLEAAIDDERVPVQVVELPFSA